MLETSTRLLELLSLLQVRREWTGPELADRLEVGVRTVRRDIERLRRLGYPVLASRGTAGGYRLGSGADLPPLLLDDEEAVAVAVGLRTAANGTISGIEETSLRALAKLEQVLPSRLRRRVSALGSTTDLFSRSGLPTVDAGVLAAIAGACRDQECVRFAYESHAGDGTRRHVEPHRLVHTGRRWYLVAYDLDREDWRTFRMDRVGGTITPGRRFAERPIPGGDAATLVQQSVRRTRDTYHARVLLHAPHPSIKDRVPAWVGTLEPHDEATTLMCVDSSWLGGLAVHVAQIGVDFTVLEPTELVDEVRTLADRFTRAVSSPP